MDPDGEEPTELRGVVSDAEGDLPRSDHAQQREEGAGEDVNGQQERNQVDLNGPQQQQQQQQQPQQNVPYPGPLPPHHQQQQLPMFPPAWPPAAMNAPPLPPQLAPAIAPGVVPPQQQAPPPPPPASHHALAMAHYYEARMRDHAAAYASAAAGAAWAAAQIAAQAAELAASANDPTNPNLPPALPLPPMQPAAAMYYPPDGAATGFYPSPQHQPVIPPGGGGGADPNLYYYSNPVMFSDQQQQLVMEEQEEYDYPYHRDNRRKRTQRRPPGGISIPRQQQQQQSPGGSNGNNNNSNSNRDRRRLRDGGDSSNSSCCSGSLGTSVTSYNSDQAMGNYNSQFRSSNGGGRGYYHRYKKKQRQPRDDSSLLGKTAVSALYEWCDKRRVKQPTFVLISPEVTEEIKEGTDFEMAVYLQDGEWGRGKGRTKNSSKQDACRKALLALYPGVAFDPESGILIELPTTAGHSNNHRKQNPESAASLEDLAPHLASRLAIASHRDDENEGATNSSNNNNNNNNAKDNSSKKLKRALTAYPGTTTSTGTSEEDDENAYYVSRGASVCSVLLHAMVQIDERIPEAPQYSFEVSKIPTANAQMKRKGPASSYGNAIVIHRGSFTCKATLKVFQKTGDPSNLFSSHPHDTSDEKETSVRSLTEGTKDENGEKRKRVGQLKDDYACSEPEAESEPNDDGQKPETGRAKSCQDFVVLEAVGVGGTKRESKHTASAKLLAQLFPECETMVEVKAAAEAAREQYAASRAMKQQSNRRFTDSSGRRRNSRGETSKSPRLSLLSGTSNFHAFGTDDDPSLPENMKQIFHSILGRKRPARKLSSVSCQVAGLEKLNLNQEPSDESNGYEDGKTVNVAHRSENEIKDCAYQDPNKAQVVQNSMCRQLSRQKQLEEQVDKALQTLNEHDEVGRTLPDELTVDDVGRLVLRRAATDDLDRIRKLLPDDSKATLNSSATNEAAVPYLSPVSILWTGSAEADRYTDAVNADWKGDDSSISLRLWSSSTFVLLLCRAIAAFEDPPLGCAVLTLGFSMQKGRLIRIAQIGSEPHLPPERFLECLEAFAGCMGCCLERNEPEKEKNMKLAGTRLIKEDLRAVVESHLCSRDRISAAGNVASTRGHSSTISSPLQSVLEESEGGEDSDKSSEGVSNKIKGQDKPCKRSRVQ